ncbi:MAPEG family protein [Thiomicrorhabdus sp. 6S3-12]|uniref:MAPEG family protein n=1 Tax=Thiomicrorhabdus sp. 6S3-12 TaxID=2819681 RepID=UPI001AADE685|nr:MAPEG family protein [Thiomicrorhabdus sp. 6S3-12]MBO1924977.1 MAPEG family protein [Thiomicrorhabdus sp. 6S3-12]
MQQHLIFYPMLVMLGLTFYTGLRMLFLRFKAVAHEGLNPRYFLHNRGGKLPDTLTQTEQHYQNLFELPILFYLLVLSVYVTQSLDPLQLVLGWLFVVSRLWHTTVHLGANNLAKRRKAFLFGGLVLILCWIDFAYHLISKTS